METEASATPEVQPRPRSKPLRTNDEINNGFGQALAGAVLEGQAPHQRPSAMPPPETPGVPSYKFTDSAGNERTTRPQPARAYGAAKAQFLRAYAAEVGVENPQFVSRNKALGLMRAAGETGNVQAVAKGARFIEIPRNRSAVNMPTMLTEDGPNFTENKQQVQGKKGELRRDSDGKIVHRTVQFGPAVDDPPLDVDTSGPEWEKYRQQSRPNQVIPLSQSNAKAAPIARPTEEQSLAAVNGMLEDATNKWGIEFRDDKKGKGFTVEAGKDGQPDKLVIALPPFDEKQAGKPKAAYRSQDEYITRLATEVGHACAHIQATRDPAARPDPLDVQKAGAKGRQTAAFAREDMIASMAAVEFVTAAGRTFTPPPAEETKHMREAQAQALAEPGGYAKVTYNAARTVRMLEGKEPTQRDQARQQKQERFMGRQTGMSAIERAAGGLPLGGDLTAGGGPEGAERPTPPAGGGQAQQRGRTGPGADGKPDGPGGGGSPSR